MMLRFIHAALTGDTSKFGAFKLRGTPDQFSAAVALYQLFALNGGNCPDVKLHWAIHKLLVALTLPVDLGQRSIDCPLDQMSFIWSCLPNGRFRIAKDISSLQAGIKFGLRCISLHAARVKSSKTSSESGDPFYADGLAEDHVVIVEDDEEASENEELFSIMERSETDEPSPIESDEEDIDAHLAKLKDIVTKGE